MDARIFVVVRGADGVRSMGGSSVRGVDIKCGHVHSMYELLKNVATWERSYLAWVGFAMGPPDVSSRTHDPRCHAPETIF